MLFGWEGNRRPGGSNGSLPPGVWLKVTFIFQYRASHICWVVIFSQTFSVPPVCQRVQCITLNLTLLTVPSLTQSERLAKLIDCVKV